MLSATAQRSFEHETAGEAHVEPAGDMQQRLVESVLQVTPQGERPAEQRHVGRILEIGEADDAREPMGRAEPMPELVLLEGQHTETARREVGGSGTPHAAHAGDDHIIRWCHEIDLDGVAVARSPSALSQYIAKRDRNTGLNQRLARQKPDFRPIFGVVNPSKLRQIPAVALRESDTGARCRTPSIPILQKES